MYFLAVCHNEGNPSLQERVPLPVIPGCQSLPYEISSNIALLCSRDVAEMYCGLDKQP